MKIRTQINGVLVIAAIVIPVTFYMALVAARDLEQRAGDITAAEELMTSATQLGQVAVETALFHESRSPEQWQQKIAGIKADIDQIKATTPSEKNNLRLLYKKIALMQLVYSRLNRPAPSAIDPGTIVAAVEARSIASLLVITQEIMVIGTELIRSDREESARALRNMQIYLGLMILMVGTLTAFLGYLVRHRILRPLRVIELGTQKVAAGIYSHRLKLQRADEIGELALAFDAMAMRIERTAVDLERHRDNLAALVSSRTAELSKAKDVAEAVSVALRDKNLELQLATSVAEKANGAKSDFLSSMSHELRTPLNAILGFAQLLESGSPAPTVSQQRSLEQILKGGWYLLELINEILDLSLIESGMASLSQEPVALAALLLECHAMIEPLAQKRGLTLQFPHFDTPAFISGDHTRVKQVLINLLSNALKYNRAEGSVTVECTLSSPDRMRISVGDTGLGLAPEQVAQLFQPFNRLGNEAGAEEGTGIGLVVAKRLVELMDGTIGVDSVAGIGSVFWVEFATASAPQLVVSGDDPLALLPPALRVDAPQRTVLCVEDNPSNLALIEQLIARRPDLRLLSASHGNLGIEFARSHQPDVILMDINLPGISGLAALHILRADPLTATIPVIALSANAIPGEIEKALAAGFFRYLAKPLRVNEFMATLDLALLQGRVAGLGPTGLLST
ncbi:ATP-binding protein [Actimicrobium antarcticum]|uniref:histidine kinase n=1 Tax=Actimicrobium antarcticum TaxID=1051899 RepID=A0ABP7TKV4_9BURK